VLTAVPSASPARDSDAHFGFSDFGRRDARYGCAGARSDIRSKLPRLLTYFRPDPVLRMPLHVAASVQRVGIGPRCPVRHQSIFRARGRARGLSAASPPLLRAAE